MEKPIKPLKLRDVYWMSMLSRDRAAYWLQVRRPMWPARPPRSKDMYKFLRGMRTPRAPIQFAIETGSRFKDIFGNGSGMLIVSTRVVKIFEDHQFRGWRTYPVQIYDKQDQLVDAPYVGISITGRAGPLDRKRSVEDGWENPDGTYSIITMKGLFFDTKTWDGSDLFMLNDDSAFVLITQRVLDVFEKNKVNGYSAVSAKSM